MSQSIKNCRSLQSNFFVAANRVIIEKNESSEDDTQNVDKDKFLQALQAEAQTFTQAVATDDGEWIVKGFVDIYRRVYTLSVDTKVVSKVLELLLYPAFVRFAETQGFDLQLAPQQNFYPDLTFVSRADGSKFAVDIKSTYRVSDTRVSGMTLGAFTGYFRNRDSSKNTLYPYNAYAGHFVLGVIYSQTADVVDERQQYTLDDLERIPSVIRSFQFFAQPKYRIASTAPGSGNTKNIGSVTTIADLVNGTGLFAALGEEVYDDYWMFYLTADMARAAGLPRPYTNLKTYLEYKQRGMAALEAHAEEIRHLAEDETPLAEADEEVG